jgi:hypothetical protein
MGFLGLSVVVFATLSYASMGFRPIGFFVVVFGMLSYASMGFRPIGLFAILMLPYDSLEFCPVCVFVVVLKLSYASMGFLIISGSSFGMNFFPPLTCKNFPRFAPKLTGICAP